MITIASPLALISMFYITVFVFKSRLHLLKLLSMVCLLVSYSCNYIYYDNGGVAFLPVVQKIALVITIRLCTRIRRDAHFRLFSEER